MMKFKILLLFFLTLPSFAQEATIIQKLTETLEKVSSVNLSCEAEIPMKPDRESKKIADKRWIHGARHCHLPWNKSPPFDLLKVNDGYFIIRQNKCVSFEAPFLYLLIGEHSALLFDSGASVSPDDFPVRKLIDEILKGTGKDLKLIVAHSHSHGDHIAGDGQFKDRPNTTVVGHSPVEVAKFFGVKNWPSGEAELDLGGRKLKIVPIPFHEASSIAIYDEQSKDLLSGDSLYPGNIFMSSENWKEAQESVNRLQLFTQKYQVRNILGAHIEMSKKPKADYEYGATYQPAEHKLPLTVEQLNELQLYLKGTDEPKSKMFDDFNLAL